MTPITDHDLARLWLRAWRPNPGVYQAPAARVIWDGIALRLQPSGAVLDTAAAVMAPQMAAQMARLAGGTVTPEPTHEALEADYGRATGPWQAGGIVAPQAVYGARLAHGCRRCDLWDETGRGGRGRCDSVRGACARRLLWLSSERCPEGKWPA